MWSENRIVPFPITPERRKHPRVPLLVRVECSSSHGYILGTCENISSSGLLIRTQQQTLDLSQEVTVRFVLPPIRTGAAIQASSLVVRAEPGGTIGLEFSELRPRDREAIAKYVEHNCRR